MNKSVTTSCCDVRMSIRQTRQKFKHNYNLSEVWVNKSVSMPCCDFRMFIQYISKKFAICVKYEWAKSSSRRVEKSGCPSSKLVKNSNIIAIYVKLEWTNPSLLRVAMSGSPSSKLVKILQYFESCSGQICLCAVLRRPDIDQINEKKCWVNKSVTTRSCDVRMSSR